MPRLRSDRLRGRVRWRFVAGEGAALTSPNEKAARLCMGYCPLRRVFRRGQFEIRSRKFGLLVGLSRKPLTHIHIRIHAEGARSHNGHHGAAGLQLDRLSSKELLLRHFCPSCCRRQPVSDGTRAFSHNIHRIGTEAKRRRNQLAGSKVSTQSPGGPAIRKSSQLTLSIPCRLADCSSPGAVMTSGLNAG